MLIQKENPAQEMERETLVREESLAYYTEKIQELLVNEL